ncbi:hypothetical protein ES708_20143 [subsurface metagenome]
MAIMGVTATGRRIAKRVCCGREWCEECREQSHKRRIARVLPRLLQLDWMAYIVTTFPMEVRPLARNPKVLALLAKRLRRLLRRRGYHGVYTRWHFFGDYAGLIGGREVNLDKLRIRYLKAFNRLIETFAKMDGSDLVLNPDKATIFWRNPGGQHSSVITGLVTDFAKTYGLHLEPYYSIEPNPHLNTFCDGGYLSPEELADLKDAIKRALLPRSMAKLIGNDVNSHYEYTRDEARKMHWVKYVTRATFLEREWDGQLASMLYGFHNGGWAGTWDGPPKWKLTGTDKKYNALIQLAEGRHPVSGEPITWDSEPIPWVLVLTEDPVHLGGWWYDLPPARSPPRRLDGLQDELNRLRERFQARAKARAEGARAKAAAEAAVEAEYLARLGGGQ